MIQQQRHRCEPGLEEPAMLEFSWLIDCEVDHAIESPCGDASEVAGIVKLLG